MITSTGNAQIRNINQIRRKPKERDAQDVFLVEGIKMFLEAPAERIRKAYLSESFYQKYASQRQMGRLLQRIPYEITTDQVFESMSDTRTPQGVICLVKQFHYREADLLGNMTESGEKNCSGEQAEGEKEVCSGGQAENGKTEYPARQAGTPLCMVLENLQDPGNLGTILRTAEGAGVTGILLTDDCVDLYNPKVIRSTMGSIYRMPFLYTDDLAGTLLRWKDKGIRLCAAHLSGEHSYDKEDYRGGCAFLIGNESRGLTDETCSLADTLVRIPMLGRVESLNAAVASAVLMYEAARQRRGN